MSKPTLYAPTGLPAARPAELQDLIDDGWLVLVEPDGTLTTTDNTEYILIRVGIGGDDAG